MDLRPWLLLVLLAAPAAAHEESDAPLLRDDVVRVHHDPDPLRAGQQFRGFLELAPDSQVERVMYQVCVVSELVCILSPQDAQEVSPGLWTFDTATRDAPGQDRPVHWEGRVGVQWFLGAAGEEDLEPFPEGTPMKAPECQGGREAAVACYETHYFAFDVVPEDRDAPAPVLWAALVLAAWAVRRWRV